jgi:hypothetical protein
MMHAMISEWHSILEIKKLQVTLAVIVSNKHICSVTG